MENQIKTVPTPCYIVDERLLIKNLNILNRIEKETGCHILLAQKAFSMYATYPLLGKYLSGTTASSLYEAKLGAEEMGKEVHIYAPAYKEEEMDEILQLCDHIVFNSYEQWKKYQHKVETMKQCKPLECGLRINPEYSEIEVDLYNPCYPNSRFGVKIEDLVGKDLTGLDGLHFHTMCEQGADVLERTLKVVEEKFKQYILQMKWINFGGGHHITREDYDVDKLIQLILHIQKTYGVEVYLEPGEAIAYNAGYLITRVLDVMKNGMEIAILDTSATCHMPDVIEMPYRPKVIDAGMPMEFEYTYRLAGPTCLSGDVIGDYSFRERLKPGDRLVFCDMAIYSMVKNNTFNGMKLPSILLYKENGGLELIKEFHYEDFKGRLS